MRLFIYSLVFKETNDKKYIYDFIHTKCAKGLTRFDLFHLGSDDCYALDLRLPKDDWEWEKNGRVPKLKEKLNSYAMEYVPFSKKIYILGGREDDGSSDPSNIVRI